MTRDELARRIAETAVLRGTFTLRSGRTSSYYIDKYLFLTRPEILLEVGAMIASRLPPEATCLAGAELGGVPLVTAVSLASGLPSVYVRGHRKGYGTGNLLEGRLEPGDKVVLVEDVATTGGQAIEAATAVRDAGADVLSVVATVDRQEGARENVEKAGLRFEALFTISDLGLEPESDI
ncbi:MAG: orotate phosphoribosyltransferase [Planctomycetota bacterium]